MNVSDHLFVDFTNSELYDGRGNLDDRLQDASWRREFRAAWDLPRLGDLDDLVELRSAIRSSVDRIADGRKPSTRDLARVDAALAAAPVRYRLTPRGLESVPLATGPAAAAGAIALSFARFLDEGQLDRLKTCDNDGCRWVFHDDTRNRARRWCGPCGNVDKVRRFRERQRSSRGA
jgi:predicted RNA-binding Zn ribbon-like protein